MSGRRDGGMALLMRCRPKFTNFPFLFDCEGLIAYRVSNRGWMGGGKCMVGNKGGGKPNAEFEHGFGYASAGLGYRPPNLLR